MKNVKAKSRSLRSDEHLSDVLTRTTATLTVGADIHVDHLYLSVSHCHQTEKGFLDCGSLCLE